MEQLREININLDMTFTESIYFDPNTEDWGDVLVDERKRLIQVIKDAIRKETNYEVAF